MLHNFLNPFSQATPSLRKPVAPVPLAKWSRLSTSRSQPTFTAWLPLGISRPPSSSHIRLLYFSGRVALGRTKVGADLGFHHPGNPRACAPSGQLQTISEHHHPAPAQLIFHRGQRLVVSGHSQSLKLTGLYKSLPLTCQQQSRLNYERTVVYSAHTKGTPEYPVQVILEAVPLDLTGHLVH